MKKHQWYTSLHLLAHRAYPTSLWSLSNSPPSDQKGPFHCMSSWRRKTKEQQHKNRIKTNIHARLFQISFEIILHALQTAALVLLNSVNNLHGHRRHILQSRENCLGQGAPARGVLNKCLYGEASPRGPTPYPFIDHFSSLSPNTLFRILHPFQLL